jgi:hypothetical protein
MIDGTLLIGTAVTQSSCGLDKGILFPEGTGICTFAWNEDDDNNVV